MASSIYNQRREEKDATVVWLVDLIFPAFLTLPAKSFYWATTQGIQFFNRYTNTDINYDHVLSDVPKGRHQRDRGNDYAEFAINNVANRIYQEFLPAAELSYESIIEKGKVIIWEAYEIEKDYYEAEVRFYGYLKDFTIDETDKQLKFTAFSDMSRQNFLVANRILTRERCGTAFSFGLLAPDALVPCTWQTIQGGNPDFCSKFKNGIDSCNAHNNTHQFFAVPALATATVEFVPRGDVGFGYDTDSCFSQNMHVVLDRDFNTKPINEFEVGDKHLGFDIWNNDVLIESEVLSVESHVVDSICYVLFSAAILEVTKEHLAYIGNRKFTPVGALSGKTMVGMNLDGKQAQKRIYDIGEVSEILSVFNLRTSCATLIICDKNKKFFYLFHNNKASVPQNL